MARLLLCANPAASGFTGGLHRDVIARLRETYDVDAEWPKSPADTRALCKTAATDGVDVVAAMGGDGVVHHVANGISGSGTALGIIPAGTTNVFGRIIGIPRNPKKAADLLCGNAEPRPVPTALLTLTDANGLIEQRVATFSAGVGLDAEVVEVAEQEPFRKYRFGAIHYARSTASVVWRNFADRKPGLIVSSGDRTTEAVAVLIQIHDKYTFFGRAPMQLGRQVANTFTILVARQLPRSKVVSLFLGTATRRDLNRLDGIEIWDGVDSIAIESTGSGIPAQADGEILGTPHRLTAELRPTDLMVLTPPTS